MRSPSARTLRLLAIAAVLAASGGRHPARAVAQPVDAGSVTIIRDRFGVPHVYGPTDASVVFGLAYAQAEDNLELLEYSALLALGRATELEGEGAREEAFWSALLVRAFEVPRLAREEYQRAPPAMRALYDAYAAGLNHYLARHPGSRLRVLERFEPWHTLAMLREKYYLQEFIWYTGLRPRELRISGLRWREDGDSGAAAARDGAEPAWRRSAFPPPAAFAAAERAAGREPAQGSNMWAVAPSRSASGSALLFMNPHIGFFGPYQYYESHLASGEGLHFSGTGRYGFPLPYIGHNERLGWSHTDNDPDHGDLYLERFEHPSDPLAYRYGDGWRQAVQWTDTIRVRTAAGVEARTVTLLRTHHGPVVAERDGRRVAVRLAKLEEGGWYDQWYAMARAQSLEEFRAALDRSAIPYMNVVYADADGNIFYIYNGVVPRRATGFEWRGAVAGDDPRTEWQGFHSARDLPQLLNPSTGYVQNTNSTPFTTTRTGNPDAAAFPPYMVGSDGDNARARVSREILESRDRFDFEAWARAATDTRVLAARDTIPLLLRQLDSLRAAQPERAAALDRAAQALREWDGVGRIESPAMTLFILAAEAPPPEGAWPLVQRLEHAVARLRRAWGTELVPWGEVNRLQRAHWSGRAGFSESEPSLPVPGGPGWVGMVYNFYTDWGPGERRRYGEAGNSYVGVVEFAPRVRARSIVYFGQSGDPASPHWFDQAPLYARGEFKPAWFHRDEVEANALRTYHPGEEAGASPR